MKKSTFWKGAYGGWIALGYVAVIGLIIFVHAPEPKQPTFTIECNDGKIQVHTKSDHGGRVDIWIDPTICTFS